MYKEYIHNHTQVKKKNPEGFFSLIQNAIKQI
jgi:hypothetical protein